MVYLLVTLVLGLSVVELLLQPRLDYTRGKTLIWYNDLKLDRRNFIEVL